MTLFLKLKTFLIRFPGKYNKTVHNNTSQNNIIYTSKVNNKQKLFDIQYQCTSAKLFLFFYTLEKKSYQIDGNSIRNIFLPTDNFENCKGRNLFVITDASYESLQVTTTRLSYENKHFIKVCLINSIEEMTEVAF